MTDFQFRDQVRFADLDARGHLNNVAFLTFVEAARIAYLRSVDASYDPTTASERDLILAHTSIDYRAQVSFEEYIVATVRPQEVSERKLTLAFELHAEEDGRLLAEAINVMVGFDYERQEPTELADTLRRGLQAAAAR